ncbi:hypothetical protein ACFQX9_30085 [Bradyrhizobium sp. GCM10028915]|uniref:hypothetical protein n=1 Tax=Bradyrhizobium sp. GCM10028915 TaxID=3273385 RepID=UPI00360F5C0C
MFFHNKSNFESTLSNQFRISSGWRGKNAKRYGHDDRNAKASRRLLELEAAIHISDDAWNRLAPLVTSPACLAAISETNRDVCFRTDPPDFSAWLDSLQANLTRGVETGAA